MAQGAAGFEQEAEGIDVDAHPQVEVGFGLTADHRGQVEDRACFHIDNLLDHRRVGNIAGDDFHPGIVKAFRRHHVEQHQFVDFLLNALSILQYTALQQLFCQTFSQKTGAACNQYVHAISLSQLSPSSVFPRGRYSQPT